MLLSLLGVASGKHAVALAVGPAGWSERWNIRAANIVLLALPAKEPKPDAAAVSSSTQMASQLRDAPVRASSGSPRLQNPRRKKESTFADPTRRIVNTVSEQTLPAKVELLRSRLPSDYALAKPLYANTVNTQHTLEVIVGALLAVTDGRLDSMRERADAQAVARLNQGIDAAKALTMREPSSTKPAPTPQPSSGDATTTEAAAETRS